LNTIVGDLWDFHDKGHWVVITTNGSTKKDGRAVMGKGTALQAAQRFPQLQKELGSLISEHDGNHSKVFDQYRLFTLPVKNFWHQRADLELIRRSLSELSRLIDLTSSAGLLKLPVYLPKPGCGSGQLDWTDVRPLVKPLVDEGRAIIVDREVSHA
jgi:hypothetical protein